MVLLIEFFQHKDPNRHNEYIQCLKENVENDQITTIDVVISDDVKLPLDHPKITITERETRPTYNDFFRICNTKYKDQICILSNSDIIFTDLSMITDETVSGKFIALSRWDILPDGNIRLFDREDSQDCWIFKSPIEFKVPPTFYLGKPGCDNRIAYMGWESGYVVNNPSKQIITKHLHLTNLRNYGIKDTVCGMHMRVRPCDNITRPSHQTRFPFNI